MLSWTKITGILTFLTGLSLGIYFITLQILGASFTHFPGDLGDARFNLYLLEHAYKFFTGQVESFWNATIMYPETNVIAFSDNLLGSAPIYSIFRIFGMDIYTSYQWWFLILTILNYTACYLFLKALFKNSYAAALGAMVFAFSIALQSQMTHSQTFARFAIPLAFWMVIYFKKEFKTKYFFAALLFVVYQIYCGIYIGLMLAVPIAIFLIILYIRNARTIKSLIKNKKWAYKIIASLLVNILLLLPLIIPYMKRPYSISIRHYREILDTIPTIKSYFFSQEGSLFWDFFSKTGAEYPAWWDHQIFAGGIATICLLAFAGIIAYRLFAVVSGVTPETTANSAKNNTLFYLLLTGLATKLLFLRVGRISAFIFIFFLPGFSSMRSLTRIINIELIFFAIAAAFIFLQLCQVLRPKPLQIWKSSLIFLFLAGLLITDNYFKQGKSYTTEKAVANQSVRSLINLIKDIPEGSLISYEPQNKEKPVAHYQIDAMLAAQENNLKTINAYTAVCPPGYAKFWSDMDAEFRNYWLSSKNFEFDTLYVIKSEDVYDILIKKDTVKVK